MEILIEITEENKTSKLNMRGVSRDSEKAIITGFFNAVGVTEAPSTVVIDNKTNVTSETPIDAEHLAKQIEKSLNDVFEEADNKKSDETSKIERPRRLPLIGSEHRTTAKVSEAASIVVENKQQEHWITGIKVDEDGTKRYRCHYWCSCGGKGKRYIPLETKTISCRECEKELQVQAATLEIKDGIPGRDDFGNFFIAKASI